MFMPDTTCSFVENIGGVSFIVSMKSADGAKLTHEELVKKLITKEAMAMDEDAA